MVSRSCHSRTHRRFCALTSDVYRPTAAAGAEVGPGEPDPPDASAECGAGDDSCLSVASVARATLFSSARKRAAIRGTALLRAGDDDDDIRDLLVMGDSSPEPSPRATGRRATVRLDSESDEESEPAEWSSGSSSEEDVSSVSSGEEEVLSTQVTKRGRVVNTVCVQ